MRQLKVGDTVRRISQPNSGRADNGVFEVLPVGAERTIVNISWPWIGVEGFLDGRPNSHEEHFELVEVTEAAPARSTPKAITIHEGEVKYAVQQYIRGHVKGMEEATVHSIRSDDNGDMVLGLRGGLAF